MLRVFIGKLRRAAREKENSSAAKENLLEDHPIVVVPCAKTEIRNMIKNYKSENERSENETSQDCNTT